ncbi:MAG: hypothetical protein D6728_14655 [Cyanobacteria bacterium J055]|nr:MAG: hypothetical protein D6728_14655 [Cyanobacteria bacterium J055]
MFVIRQQVEEIVKEHFPLYKFDRSVGAIPPRIAFGMAALARKRLPLGVAGEGALGRVFKLSEGEEGEAFAGKFQKPTDSIDAKASPL